MNKNPLHPLMWTLKTHGALLTIVLIIIHQSLIASSAYFLTETIHQYQTGLVFHNALIFYFASMIIPFIPGCFSYVSTNHWINTLHRKFSLSMAESAYGNVAEYRSSERKASFDSALSRNSFSIISSYVMLSHDFLSLVLNSVLSILVIGFLLPSDIALGYIISLVLSIVIVVVLSKTIQTLSIETEKRYADYGNTLHKTWDNMVVSNAYHAGLWRKNFDIQSTAYYTSSFKLSLYKQSGNIIIAFAALLPTAYLIYNLLIVNTLEAGLVAAIIVNLTRIFHILNSLSSLVYELIEWASASARMRYLLQFLEPSTSKPLPEGPLGPITLNGADINHFDAVQRQLQDQKTGRITIRGGNGAGKSTLLLTLKKAFPDHAFFLPAKYEQLYWRDTYDHLSTGQRACAIINEVLQQSPSIQYLLLDEWDANLDHENRKAIDSLLDTVSQARVVVEVRH